MEIERAGKAGNRQWHTEADVVVIGAGGAGLAAAIEAASLGVTTLLLEKQSHIYDSSTALSAGMFAFAGTERQRSQGIVDTDECMYEDILNVGKRENDAGLVRRYVKHQLDTYRWLEEMGIEWSAEVSAASGMSVPRGHSTHPLELVRALKAKADECGVSFFFDTKAVALITDETGRVIGVTIEGPGARRMDVAARRGVILAAGGFARDPGRLERIDGRFKSVAVTAGAGHTGECHHMAEALGAFMKDMQYVKPSFELYVDGTSVKEILLMFCLGAIIVNTKGTRFVNESISYKDIGVAALDEPGSIGYQIFDRKIFDIGVEKSRKIGESMPPEYFAVGLDDRRIDLLVRADTLEELAVKVDIPPQALVDTVRRYNDSVAAGVDGEFGRATLSGDYGTPLKIDEPPYYSYATKSHFLATYAGVVVDGTMRVLTENGTIEGLYAAGEIIGGFHGASYHTGTALGKAVIFGRIAGKTAATDERM